MDTQSSSGQSELSFSSILDSYEAYGCRVNAISIDELFRRYEQAGFLYPGKMQWLAPYWPLVRENWERAYKSPVELFRAVVFENDGSDWASICLWNSTGHRWCSQHLVGVGGPAASRNVLLGSMSALIAHRAKMAWENWFQRTNRFANKVFGSITETLGERIGWVGDYTYFAFTKAPVDTRSDAVHVRACTSADANAMRRLAGANRSAVYVAAEGLDEADLCLESVDDLYRKVGLRRYRNVLVAEHHGHDALAGIALAYRGPLGLNFSFLENRCDLILNKALSEQQRRDVIAALLRAAIEHYADFPPQMMPVVADLRDAAALRDLGGQHIRDYAQSVWLRDGYEAWYRHVEQIYDRVARAERRIGLGRGKAEGTP